MCKIKDATKEIASTIVEQTHKEVIEVIEDISKYDVPNRRLVRLAPPRLGREELEGEARDLFEKMWDKKSRININKLIEISTKKIAEKILKRYIKKYDYRLDGSAEQYYADNYEPYFQKLRLTTTSLNLIDGTIRGYLRKEAKQEKQEVA